MINDYKTFVRYGLLIPVLAIVLVNLAYLAIVRMQAGDGRWVEEPVAKSWLLSAAHNSDYVFLGSSRTQNHINTMTFDQQGISAVNLGMAGRHLNYYPFLVKRAIASNAKNIVISIPVGALFKDIKCPDGYFYQLQIDTLHATEKRCFSFGNMEWDTFLNELPMNRFRRALERVTSSQGTQKQLRVLEEKYSYRKEQEDRTVIYVRWSSPPTNRYVVAFSNGDGQVFSDRVRNTADIEKVIKDRSARSFNANSIDFLRKMARLAQQGDARMIYIIEPSRVGITYIIDTNKLKSLLPGNVEIINNAHPDRYYAQELWADKSHFNLEGTELYTQQLLTQLGAIVQD